jgi:hypothetical protein
MGLFHNVEGKNDIGCFYLQLIKLACDLEHIRYKLCINFVTAINESVGHPDYRLEGEERFGLPDNPDRRRKTTWYR